MEYHMSDSRTRGRPRKSGFVVIKINAPIALRDYLDEVKIVQSLPDRSAAGVLVLSEAAESRRFLNIDATIAGE
jgi:hypothetical protein